MTFDFRIPPFPSSFIPAQRTFIRFPEISLLGWVGGGSFQTYPVPYLFLLRKTRTRGHEPAVTDGALVQVVSADALHNQLRVLVNILQCE